MIPVSDALVPQVFETTAIDVATNYAGATIDSYNSMGVPGQNGK